MLRRALLLLAMVSTARAGTREQIQDLLGEMASSLSEGDPAAFISALDPRMPDYDALVRNVTALAAQNLTLSSIEIVSDGGDDRRRSAELDWLLEIRSRLETGPLVRRREKVVCKFQKQGRRWKVVELSPLSLFEPPRPR